MAVDKLKPNDRRVQTMTTKIRGKTYQYMLGKPGGGTYRATVLLVHGWPDLGFGWRYQVPYLLSLGLQVIVPDMLGYGGTDAPEDVSLYSLKSVSDDMVELVGQICWAGEKIILGGHDWGGALVWRFALWHAKKLQGMFSVCTPYWEPLPVFIDYARLVELLPNFRYQIQLCGPDVEREIGHDAAKIRGLLTGLCGATGPNGETVFTTDHGCHFEHLDKMGKCPLLDDDEVDYYVSQHARKGMRGPLNWYRTRRHNYEEELALLRDALPPKIKPPSLMITALHDPALPLRMSEGMERHFESLKKVTVDGTHWALWDSTEQVNSEIGKFVEEVLSFPVKAKV